MDVCVCVYVFVGMCARVRVWLYVRVCLWVRVFGLVVNIQLYNTMAFCICLCIDRHIYCVFICAPEALGACRPIAALARRARPHAPVVHRRDIGFTKVKALPESLGNCTRLEELCVRYQPLARGRAVVGLLCVRAGAGAGPRHGVCGGRLRPAEPRVQARARAGGRGRPGRA